jgi:quercetin dioxygenase-like cupin family protein
VKQGGKKMSEIQKISWKTIKEEKLSDHVSRQTVFGEKGTLARLLVKRGEWAARHSHNNEEYLLVISGAQKYIFDGREIVVNAGEALVIPPNTPHTVVALEDSVCVYFFAPVREDWLRGEDQYLRR